MENLVPTIRNAARALIVRENRVLLLRKGYDGQGERFALPGGAQDLGETLGQALNRECLEEIGTTVQIRDLLHVADHFKSRDTDPPSTRHLVEFLFDCTVPDAYTPRSGHHPDRHQMEVVWAELNDLQTMPLFPRSLTPYLTNYGRRKEAVYLGPIG